MLRAGDTAFSMYLSRETKLRFFEAYRSWPEWAGAAAAARRRNAAAKHEPQRLADEEVELRAARAAAAARPELAAAAARGRLVVNGTIIDAVVCSHPTGACELYMPFGQARQGRGRRGGRVVVKVDRRSTVHTRTSAPPSCCLLDHPAAHVDKTVAAAGFRCFARGKTKSRRASSWTC